ncbi:hypothetical protein [Halalkalibacter nanhaiisediminis]|uniref:UPF0738 protein IQ10_03419 n=1 Tax=Halalkalibacter nanhaiisediminis TaxID=688079 RepID=A0A562Q947_9BACI|nr:hypothetical protein [Halalkalibacter nanhaiisediminis]TWI53285.1 hypothetical protein IQ10_03419 [Halalkalibacter nanhaiisediminis]
MKKLHVETIKKENDHYIATVSEVIDKELAQSLRAGERMLVDSDNLAFIYILEDDTEFYYVNFSQKTWSDLKQLYTEAKKLELILHEEVVIELTSICEELSFLTENIEGNGNYGEEMEKAVQEVFAQHT